MSHWARPGVKCVCIDGSREPFSRHPKIRFRSEPVEVRNGEVYTVRSVEIFPVTGDICIKVHELHDRSPDDYGYHISRFRPLIARTQEQDMELFTPLLDVRNHDELEREFQ